MLRNYGHLYFLFILSLGGLGAKRTDKRRAQTVCFLHEPNLYLKNTFKTPFVAAQIYRMPITTLISLIYSLRGYPSGARVLSHGQRFPGPTTQPLTLATGLSETAGGGLEFAA